MGSDVGETLRQFVAQRANHRCEYCLLHQDDSYSPHHVDHIISRKHGGLTDSDNLAYACLRCNAWKGSDVGSFDPKTGRLARLYDPRHDRWDDHFVLRRAVIEPLTEQGAATARLLKLNLDRRVAERRLLVAAGRYPR